jgi:chorismate synthase
MSVNAVKGVEIGAGFAAARLGGEANADPETAGGVAGGIATGEPILLRVAFKPTSSVPALGVAGRHDPCVGIRGAPVIEAMVAMVLADHKLLHRAQCG